jgi:hypothetical protein
LPQIPDIPQPGAIAFNHKILTGDSDYIAGGKMPGLFIQNHNDHPACTLDSTLRLSKYNLS